MKHFKTLSTLLIAAAVAVPAISMAQDRDDHKAEPQHVDQQRGAGPDHAWHKGDSIPAEYRGKSHEVTDWKARHLRQPPSGYHWVQVNGDFVLAAITTGVIADMLLGN